MLGDPIPKHSIIVPDWEATNEAIEEQVARESYLQWLRDNERRHAGNSKSATVTSADLRQATSEATSPSRAKNLVEEETKAARSSPKPCCSHTTSSEPLQSLVSKMVKKQIIIKPIHRSFLRRFHYSLQSSPKAGCSSQRDSPKPSSSSQPQSSSDLPTGTCHCHYPRSMQNKWIHTNFVFTFFCRQ